jgi:hypothetical protein
MKSIKGIMKFSTNNGSTVEYINMDEFPIIQYLPDKNIITFQKLVNDQPHIQIRKDVDKDSVCIL